MHGARWLRVKGADKRKARFVYFLSVSLGHQMVASHFLRLLRFSLRELRRGLLALNPQ